MPKFIRFSRDVRLPDGIEYVSRKWYPVPNDVAQALRANFPDLAVDIQNKLPEEEAPAGDSVEADLIVEVESDPDVTEESEEDETTETPSEEEEEEEETLEDGLDDLVEDE